MPPSTREELLAAARASVTEIDAAALQRELVHGGPQLLDVREQPELEAGKLPGALHLPRGFLELRAETALPDRERELVVYCAGGTRSLLAAATLQQMGYQKVRSLSGGFTGWVRAGLPVEASAQLSAAQLQRYARHLSIPEVGTAGQQKLLAARVLLLGAGGLGSPAALYLAAAGVGRLRLVDDDRVEASNLQRQVLHTTSRVGMGKTASARATLSALSPDLQVEERPVRLTRQNALELVDGCDVVVDGSDNFRTRYLLNDACLVQQKPLVHASIFRFDGQASTFVPGPQNPCYRCLFPEPPPAGVAPSCEEAGVLGALPGMLGTLQAIEALKLILGIGEPLIGRLLLYDALSQRVREVRYAKDPSCAGCRAPLRELLAEQDDPACTRR